MEWSRHTGVVKMVVSQDHARVVRIEMRKMVVDRVSKWWIV